MANVGSLRRYLRLPGRLRRWFALPRPRAAYRTIWDEGLGDDSEAMVKIAGHRDPIEFERTGRLTVELLEQTVGVQPDDVALEIGAGIGRVGQFLAPRIHRWIGADVSPRMLSLLRQRLSASPNVSTSLLTGYDLSPIPDKSVDLVYSTVVYMHLDEWERYSYVAEGRRVLKPGGRMLVDNVDLTSAEGWEFFLNTRSMYSPSQRPPQISRASTPDELRTYFERAGFVDITIERRGLWLVAFGRAPA